MPELTTTGKKQHRSLAVTLAIAFIVISLTVISLTGSLQAYANYQNQEKIIAEEQMLIAKGASDTVRTFIQEKLALLKASVSLGSLAGSDYNQQTTTLEKLLHLDPAFRQVILTNTHGKVINSISRQTRIKPKELLDLYWEDILSRAGQKETYISPVYIDESSSEPMVLMAVPVTDVFGDYQGILAAEVNLKFMWDLVDNLKIGNSGLTYVVDGKGNLIAFGDISRVLKGENVLDLKIVQQFVSAKGALPAYGAEVTRGIRGYDVVANYVPLGTPDWAVVVEMPAGEAYRHLTEGMMRTILILCISLVLAIIAGMYLARWITRPLIRLRDATQEISRGNLDTRVEIQSDNEIGELAESFNTMTRDLQKTTVSRNYMDDILTSMFDMMVVLRPDSSIQSVNKSTCDVLGYRKDELVGKPFDRMLAAQETQFRGHAWIDELIETGTFRDTEIVFITKDGRTIPVVFSASVMRNRNMVQGIVCVAHDITRRKEAEEALKIAHDELELRVHERTAELTMVNRALEAEIAERKRGEDEIIRKSEELSAAYEELTATEEELRHNFNELTRSQQALSQARKKLNIFNTVTFQDIENAVFSLSGYLALENDLDPDGKHRDYLAKEKKIVGTITEALNFAGRYQNLGLKPPLWQNVMHAFLIGISHLDLSLLSRRADIEGLEIFAEPQLDNVFFTLAENVLLHAKTATEISLSYRESPDGLTIIFEDNGSGVTAENKEKIFDRRYEEKKGMGLFLVREILGITNITIRETGEPSRGARFEFFVPEGTYRFTNRDDTGSDIPDGQDRDP